MTLGRAYFGAQALGGAVWWIAVFLWQPVRTSTLGGLDPLLVTLLDVPLFVVMSAVAAFGVRWAALTVTVWTGLVTVGLAIYATVTTFAGLGVVVMASATVASLVALSLMWTDRIALDLFLIGPMRFATADPARTQIRNVAATCLQILIFWGVLLAAVPLALQSLEQRWKLSVEFPTSAVIAGLVLLLAASALGIWSAVTISTLGAGTPLPSATAALLVVAGPYRYVRNPMAVSGIAQGVAVGLVLSSWLTVEYAIVGSLVWNYAVRPFEEEDLERRFGDAFCDYRLAVRCWLPRLRPVAPSVVNAK